VISHDSPKTPSRSFLSLVDKITETGYQWHKSRLIDQAKANLHYITKSIKHLDPLTANKSKKAIVINAGPSVIRTFAIERIKKSNFNGTKIVDCMSLDLGIMHGIV
jgi:hypothetical protein